MIKIISSVLELRVHLRMKKSAYSDEFDDTAAYDRVNRRESSTIMTNIVPSLSPDDPLTYEQYLSLVLLKYK